MPTRAIIGWFRPYVLEATDGILTSAGISEGLAGADVTTRVLLFGAATGLLAGGLAVSVTEYSKAASERDQQLAQIETERRQHLAAPEAELEELTQMYVARGLSPDLARQVATELTGHDALQAHTEAELGITPVTLVVPRHAAVAAGSSFAVGALVPLLAMALIPGSTRPWITFAIVVLALSATGWFSARLSGVRPAIPIARTAGTGVVAMAITYLAGTLLHP